MGTTIIPKLRGAFPVLVETQTYPQTLGNSQEESTCYVYIDLSRKEYESVKGKTERDIREFALKVRPNEKYVSCHLFDDCRGKHYEYHIPLEVFFEFADKQHLLYDEYVCPNDVKSYGSGVRSV